MISAFSHFVRYVPAKLGETERCRLCQSQESAGMTPRRFWSLYMLASLASAGVSLSVFQIAVHSFARPYEEAVIMAGLLAMPINWLWAEQLTWRLAPPGRVRRALRYFCAYAVAILADAAVVHLCGHVWRLDDHLSAALGVAASMLWMAPANRYLVWVDLPGFGRRCANSS
jgi:putative flippase GtrA